MNASEIYKTNKKLRWVTVGNGKATHVSVNGVETLCGREGRGDYFGGDLCVRCDRAAMKFQETHPLTKESEAYVRTEIPAEKGAAPVVTMQEVKDALTEVNHAMLDGKHEVREMSSSHGQHFITYKDGRFVRLELMSRTEAESRVDKAAVTPKPLWSVAGHRSLLHRFTEANGDGRALCNKSFRPWKFINGYSFQTRADRDASQYGYLYTYCAKCEAK